MSDLLSFFSECWSEVLFISENYPLGFGFLILLIIFVWSLFDFIFDLFFSKNKE